MNGLKPCPFCKCPKITVGYHSGEYSTCIIACTNRRCGATIKAQRKGESISTVYKIARDRWNRREGENEK